MNITITDDNGFFTVELHTEQAINFTKVNTDIPNHMIVRNNMILFDNQEELQDFIIKVLQNGITASINNTEITLNSDNAIIFLQESVI